MIVFGSRGSDLALTQSRAVAEALKAATGEPYRIEVIETRGDVVLDKPLPAIGGKGLFTAELEEALLGGRIDVAVHSMKDLPVEDREGLTIGAVPQRAATTDVLVYDPRFEDPQGAFVPLKQGVRVGTSSHRRRAALALHRPDLDYADVRGNVPTRVQKVRRGDYAGVILAAAGLDRLALPLDGLKRVALTQHHCPPAPAQGALAVQCRRDDARVLALLASLHDVETARCAATEREVLAGLGGGCSMPLGALATREGVGYRLQLALFAPPRPDQGDPRGAGVFLDLRGDDPLALARHAAHEWAPLVGEPLRGVDVTLLRPEGCNHDLDDALAVAGARVRTLHPTRTVSLAMPSDIRDTLRAARTIAFTSARAVEVLCASVSADLLTDATVFAVGPATANALLSRGIACEHPGVEHGGEALARLMLARGIADNRVIHPCAQERHPDFESTLRAHGVQVDAIPIYRTEAQPGFDVDEAEGGWLVFTSPSAVRAYAGLGRDGTSQHVAFGAATRTAMQDLGVRCDFTATQSSAAALVKCFLESSHA